MQGGVHVQRYMHTGIHTRSYSEVQIPISPCLYLSIHLSICHSVYLSIYLDVSLFRCLSISGSRNLPISVSLYLSIYLSHSVCLPACLPVCLSVCLSVSVLISPHLSISISISLYPSVSLSHSLSLSLSIYPFLSISVYIYLSICLATYLSIYLHAAPVCMAEYCCSRERVLNGHGWWPEPTLSAMSKKLPPQARSPEMQALRDYVTAADGSRYANQVRCCRERTHASSALPHFSYCTRQAASTLRLDVTHSNLVQRWHDLIFDAGMTARALGCWSRD